MRHAFHPRQHRESKGIELARFPIIVRLRVWRVCLFGQITEKREKCWRLPNKKAHCRQNLRAAVAAPVVLSGE